MKEAWVLVLGAACGAGGAILPRVAMHLRTLLRDAHSGRPTAGAARAHTEEKFAFTADASMKEVAPLFGADAEREWAPGWDPKFVHPLPARDEQGMVFTVERAPGKSVWLNTAFDLMNGRIQYAYMIPNTLVTLITLQLTQERDKTRVEVEYERTALSAEADGHVRRMAEQDHTAGADWEKQIHGYLKKRQG